LGLKLKKIKTLMVLLSSKKKKKRNKREREREKRRGGDVVLVDVLSLVNLWLSFLAIIVMETFMVWLGPLGCADCFFLFSFSFDCKYILVLGDVSIYASWN
jgi:hypothetical protein